MGSAVLEQAAGMALRMGDAVPLADKEYILQFALRTGDRELTGKLASELAVPGADKEAVRQRFGVMAGFMPGWISGIEELLAALEMYRAQEGKALGILAEINSAYGIGLPGETAREPLQEKAWRYAGKPEEIIPR